MSKRRRNWSRLDPGPYVVFPLAFIVIMFALPYALGWR